MQRTVCFTAHDDDINAVCFADASTNILISGSDDCLAKVGETAEDWLETGIFEPTPVPPVTFITSVTLGLGSSGC
jgi:WD repeat-containing protein 23